MSLQRHGSMVLLFLLPALLLCPGSGRAADAPFELEQYRGQVVLVDFWASWCVPCRRSFPWMNRMQQKYAGDGLVIVGINMDATAEDAHTFLQDTPAEFRIVYDPGGQLARRFDVEAMPSSYVIDRNGTVIAKHLGFRDKMLEDYEATIKAALHAEED